ncbi:MAG TPA: hypothetical protein VNM22_18090 [Candidatus Limnocylindrales bacterium]|nr:hypothetical protein [Candidatus Limnocylindrales bacterium]
MKRFFIGLLGVVFMPVFAYADTATVIVKENAIRESCKFFAPVKAAVRAGNVLEILSQEGDWFQVRFNNIQGCIHKSAIEKKSVSLTDKLLGPQKQSVTGDEVALAGKGFNPQVEEAYKKKNPGMNYQAVDSIEGYKVPEDKIQEFAAGGKLNLPR